MAAPRSPGGQEDAVPGTFRAPHPGQPVVAVEELVMRHPERSPHAARRSLRRLACRAGLAALLSAGALAPWTLAWGTPEAAPSARAGASAPGSVTDALPCTQWRTSTQRDGSRWQRCTLAAPLQIAGVRWRDTVFIDPQGRVREGRLAAEAQLGAVAAPDGAWVALDPAGAVDFVFLPRTMALEAHLCRGGGHDYMTRFHPNGRLRSCWLDRDEVVDGLPCRGSGWFLLGGVSTEFHDDGRLAACTLARPAIVDGQALPAGARVQRPAVRP
jgi:hypothetical protein